MNNKEWVTKVGETLFDWEVDVEECEGGEYVVLALSHSDTERGEHICVSKQLHDEPDLSFESEEEAWSDAKEFVEGMIRHDLLHLEEDAQKIKDALALLNADAKPTTTKRNTPSILN